jgi:branched-subunit amino acid ABC-type transport system permease component
VTLIVLATLLYLVIGLILSRKLRREVLMRAISMLIVILIFYLVISALRGNPPEGDRVPIETNVPSPPPLSGEPFPAFVANPAPWLIIAVSAILAALLIGGIWLLWRRTRASPPPLTRLADGAQAALANIQAGADLRDTVLRCYR